MNKADEKLKLLGYFGTREAIHLIRLQSGYINNTNLV